MKREQCRSFSDVRCGAPRSVVFAPMRESRDKTAFVTADCSSVQLTQRMKCDGVQPRRYGNVEKTSGGI